MYWMGPAGWLKKSRAQRVNKSYSTPVDYRVPFKSRTYVVCRERRRVARSEKNFFKKKISPLFFFLSSLFNFLERIFAFSFSFHGCYEEILLPFPLSARARSSSSFFPHLRARRRVEWFFLLLLRSFGLSPFAARWMVETPRGKAMPPAD